MTTTANISICAGLEEAKALYASQAAAIDRIEEIVASERIACDFKRIDGYLYAPLGTDTDILAREMQACARIGFAGVGWAESSPLPGLAPGRCLRFPRQGRFDPLRYCAGLIAALKRLGVRLHGDTAAMEVHEEGGGVVGDDRARASHRRGRGGVRHQFAG